MSKKRTVDEIVAYIQKIDECIGILKKKGCIEGKIIFEGITSEGEKISLDEHINITFKDIEKKVDK
jgi:hypothetical protein